MRHNHTRSSAIVVISVVTLSALISLTQLSVAGTELVGRWEGAIVRENSVQLLVITLSDSAGQLVGTYEIPELGLYEEPIRELAATDSTITMRFLYGPFVLRRFDDIAQLTGENKRWNPPLQIHLKRAIQPFRPYFTKKPIAFSSGEVNLAGTVYLPEGPGPFPGVVMIHGSGDQSRAIWEYRSHLYGLVSRGVAALVYDKRGCGESEGQLNATTFDELADDATAALTTLRQTEKIDPERCGLYGISQGGWIAAKLGSRHKGVAFIVFNEGPAVSLWQQELDRVEYSLRSDGLPEPAIDSAIALTRLYFESIDNPDRWPAYTTALSLADSASWLEFVQNESVYNNDNMTWWRDNRYDPSADLSHLSCPAFAVFGEIDTNVPPKTNKYLMDSLLSAAGVAHTILVVPALPHSVSTYQTLREGAWNWPTGFWQWAYRPNFDRDLASWILAR